jgi:pimeloyl-ACP methyl ester carboxylesterase
MRSSGLKQLLLVVVLWLAVSPQAAVAQEVVSGFLPDGTPYRIDYPGAHFNGTLLVSLDYAPGGGNAALRTYLMGLGYATSGVSRNVTGWSVGDAIDNHVRVVEIFTQRYGQPTYAFVNGSSLGAHTGAAVLQARPDVFAGGILQCGGLAGAIGLWNSKLDALYIAKELLAPGDDRYPVIDIPDNFATVTRPAWLAMVQQAQQTPQGKARIALAAALANLPAWSVASRPRPAPGDYVALQQGLYDSLGGGVLPVIGQAMSSRNEINRRAGGNISWNVGVDYAALLEKAEHADVVRAMYDLAGLSLENDLQTLASAERFVADPDAIRWARVQVINEELQVPAITVNGIGDQISPVDGQQAYEAVAGSENLRQTYLEIAGHCGFNNRELAAAILMLKERAQSGLWPDTGAASLNAAAAALPLAGTPRFIEYETSEFLRPFAFVKVHAKLRAPVIVLHSNQLVQLVLTPAPLISGSTDFSAARLDPGSFRVAGAAPVASELLDDGSLMLGFRARDLVLDGTGAGVELTVRGAYIYGVPVDEMVVATVR